MINYNFLSTFEKLRFELKGSIFFKIFILTLLSKIALARGITIDVS